MKDSISVIFTTYNQPKWLEKVLWGFECQTHKDFEIVIADDGSTEETRNVIESFINKGKLNINHVWHPDEGYQKCPILNKAVLASKSDYLVFTDGDCVPREDFLEVHLKNRKKDFFLSGGAVRLPLLLSQIITRDDIHQQRSFNLKWLYKNGLPMNIKSTKLIKSPIFTRIMNTVTPARATWNGGNASGWKNDIIAINGFNETMSYGGQDREFGERLHNYGLKSKQIRYSAICIHLEHGRPYKTKESVARNILIREKIKNTKSFYIENGLNKYSTGH